MRTLSSIVTALMVALGTLVLAGAEAIRHVDIEWRHALADRWTVELTAGGTTRRRRTSSMSWQRCGQPAGRRRSAGRSRPTRCAVCSNPGCMTPR